jgi:hypothetical protein
MNKKNVQTDINPSIVNSENKNNNKINSFCSQNDLVLPTSNNQPFNTNQQNINTDYWNNYSTNTSNNVPPVTTSVTNNVPSRHTTPIPAAAITPRPTSTSSISSLHQTNVYSTHQQPQLKYNETESEKIAPTNNIHSKLKRNNSERYDQIPPINNDNIPYNSNNHLNIHLNNHHTHNNQIQQNNQNNFYTNPFYAAAFPTPQLNFPQYPLTTNNQPITIPTNNRKNNKNSHETTNNSYHSPSVVPLRNDHNVFDPANSYLNPTNAHLMHDFQVTSNQINNSLKQQPSTTLPINVKNTNMETSKASKSTVKQKKSTMAAATARTSSNNVNNINLYDSLSVQNQVPKWCDFTNSTNNFLTNPYNGDNNYNKTAYSSTPDLFFNSVVSHNPNSNMSSYSQQNWNSSSRTSVHNNHHMLNSNFPFFSTPASSTATGATSDHLAHNNHLHHLPPPPTSSNHHQQSHQSQADYVNTMKQFQTQSTAFSLQQQQQQQQQTNEHQNLFRQAQNVFQQYPSMNLLAHTNQHTFPTPSQIWPH